MSLLFFWRRRRPTQPVNVYTGDVLFDVAIGSYVEYDFELANVVLFDFSFTGFVAFDVAKTGDVLTA